MWDALREQCDWADADVVDVGCGDGFHLPVFAATARTVVGVEPHPPLVRRAGTRIEHLPHVRVVAGTAERLPLPDASADLVHARTAYFFGRGAEPGIVESDRVLRPGGALAVVDLDATCQPYGDWMLADLPRYDPVDVSRFFAEQGFSCRRVVTEWRFERRADLAAVLRIEFGERVAERAVAATPGRTLPVGYRVHVRRKPDRIVLPRSLRTRR